MTERGGTFEIPLGMAMTMAECPDAMNAFCSLSEGERAEFIARAKTVRSREEMAGLLSELSKK